MINVHPIIAEWRFLFEQSQPLLRHLLWYSTSAHHSYPLVMTHDNAVVSQCSHLGLLPNSDPYQHNLVKIALTKADLVYK